MYHNWSPGRYKPSGWTILGDLDVSITLYTPGIVDIPSRLHAFATHICCIPSAPGTKASLQLKLEFRLDDVGGLIWCWKLSELKNPKYREAI